MPKNPFIDDSASCSDGSDNESDNDDVVLKFDGKSVLATIILPPSKETKTPGVAEDSNGDIRFFDDDHNVVTGAQFQDSIYRGGRHRGVSGD